MNFLFNLTLIGRMANIYHLTQIRVSATSTLFIGIRCLWYHIVNLFPKFGNLFQWNILSRPCMLHVEGVPLLSNIIIEICLCFAYDVHSGWITFFPWHWVVLYNFLSYVWPLMIFWNPLLYQSFFMPVTIEGWCLSTLVDWVGSWKKVQVLYIIWLCSTLIIVWKFLMKDT